VFFLIVFTSFAQDVEQTIKNIKELPKQDPLTINGSLNASSVLYQAHGITPRRDPFYWVLNANLTFTILNKVSIPFSATYTQQDKNYSNGLDKFSQPYNQLGLSPKYKWLTVHAGYRAMNFSEFTYSGTIFLGGGVEIKPEQSLVSGAAFYGRLVKAVPTGGIDGVVVSLPAYKRMGGGGKVRVGNEENNVDVIFFKGIDDKYSIPFDTSLTITPAENQVMGITTKQKIGKLFNVEGDFSYSMYTDNLFQDVIKIDRFTYVNQIYEARPSTSFNKAITAAVNFTPAKFRIGLKYKRIDPDYKTMGAIFLANDVEEYSINNNFNLMSNKLNVSSSLGLQQNNLDKMQSYTSKRIIGSLNTSYNFTEQLNAGINYSNFSSNTIPVRFGISDTIKLVQLTQSGGVIANYSFGKDDIKYALNFNSSYQESGGNKQELTNNIMVSASYNILFQRLGFNIATGMLVNQSKMNNISTQSYGPMLSASKNFLNKKLKLLASGNYQVAASNGKNIFNNIVALAGVYYTLNKWLSFKMDYTLLNRTSAVVSTPDFIEHRLNVSILSIFSAASKKIFKKEKTQINATK
jgi:hypothetical protein